MTTIIDGTSGITFPNSTVQASAGSVLQVVQGTYATQTTTASSSFSSTGLTASITPKFSTSKILILTTGTFYNGASDRGILLQITRGATAIYAGNNYNVYAGATNLVIQQGLNFMDSPATTSSTTYTLNFSAPSSATVTSQYQNSTSSIILMEIAG